MLCKPVIRQLDVKTCLDNAQEKMDMAIIGQWGNTDTDYFTIVFGHDAEIRVDNGFFDYTEHTFVPRLDSDAACIRSRYGCYIAGTCDRFIFRCPSVSRKADTPLNGRYFDDYYSSYPNHHR